MSRPAAPPSEILDAGSRQSIRRFLFGVALFLVWAQMPSPRTALQNLALMAACAAAIEAAIGALRREPMLGASLNRWDVAMAFLGVYYGAQIVV
jgi:hypothetical protein